MSDATDGPASGTADAAAADGALGEEAVRAAPDRPGPPGANGVAEPPPETGPLQGQLTWTPQSAWVTGMLAVTGVLMVRAVGATLGRYALGLRRPAAITMTERGLEVTERTELLGRTLRERHAFFPIDNIVSVSREVRFARAGTYAGLAALVLGTYLGVGLLADGVRAPGTSPTLIGLGVLVVVLGLALDFTLTTVLDSARRRVRLVVRPKRGRAMCVGQLAEGPTDALLRQIAAAERPEGQPTTEPRAT